MNPENIDEKTRELVGALSFDAPAAEYALGEWFRMFPESFYRVAGGGLAPAAGPFVYRLMASDRRCCNHLCDPALMDGPTAARLARAMLLVEPRLDIRLAHAAVEWAALENDQKPLRRGLEILAAVTSGSRISSALVQLLNCRNPAVRSKVVDLLVRSSTIRSHRTIREWLGNPDPRVRANVLEALAEFGEELEWIPQVLLDSLDDPHGRAAANAAVGLYRLGLEDTALAKLSEMANSEDPTFRCSAAWAIGQVPDVKLFEILHRLRTDSDGRVRLHALKSLGSFNRAGVKAKLASIPAESGQAAAPLESQPSL